MAGLRSTILCRRKRSGNDSKHLFTVIIPHVLNAHICTLSAAYRRSQTLYGSHFQPGSAGAIDHHHWGIIFQTNIIFRLMIGKRPETPQILTREEFVTCKQTVIDSDISLVLQFRICKCNSDDPVHPVPRMNITVRCSGEEMLFDGRCVRTFKTDV